jgi:hypothetical protein
LASQVDPFVRGDDVIDRFDIAPSPFLGFVLDRLQEAQATGLINSREEALVYVQEHLESWRQSFDAPPALRQPRVESH